MKVRYKVKLRSWESPLALAVATDALSRWRPAHGFEWWVDSAFFWMWISIAAYRLWKGDRIVIDRNDPGEPVDD